MDKAVYIIEGCYDSSDDDDKVQTLGVCDNEDAARRGVLYYTLQNYDYVDYHRVILNDFQSVDTNEIFYLYRFTCYVKPDNTLGTIYYNKGRYTPKKEESISWSKGKDWDGRTFFNVNLILSLKDELPSILTKEHRKMIRDKIYELSKGEIKCIVPFEDIEIE